MCQVSAFEAADFDGDSLLDIYLADFHGADELLLVEKRGVSWKIAPVPESQQ